MASPRILVVQSSGSKRLTELLGGHALHLRAVGSGAAATEALGAESWAMVVVDVPSGGTRPFELVRRAAAYPNTEVIAVVPAGDSGLVAQALELGAHAAVQHPIDARVLVHAVKRGLDHRAHRVQSNVYRASLAVLTAPSPEALLHRMAHVAVDLLRAGQVDVLTTDGETCDWLAGAPGRGVPTPSLVQQCIDDWAVMVTPPEPHGDAHQLVHPLMLSGRLLGVLVAQRRGRPFDAHDVETAGLLASQLSLLLDNMDLRVQAETTQDTLARTQRVWTQEDLTARLGLAAVRLVQRLDRSLKFSDSHLRALEEAHGTPATIELRESYLQMSRQTASFIRMMRHSRQADVSVQELVDAGHAMSPRGVGSRLRSTFPNGLRAHVEVGAVAHALACLFENALEVGAAQIDVTAKEMGADVCICVRDDGPGMPQEVLMQAQEAFFSTKTDGSGLGLPTCVHLIESQGGRVEITSTLGEGTQARVFLPRGEADEVFSIGDS